MKTINTSHDRFSPAIRWMALAASCAMMVATTTTHAEVTKVPVFDSGEDGYNTYRIPAIVRAANGDLLAFAEGRKNSGSDSGDIDIVLKRSTDQGKSWGAMKLVQDEFSNPTAAITIGNPAPVVDLLDPVHPGRIWLPFSRNNDRVFVTYSGDNGATWANRTEITSTAKSPAWSWYATGPVHGIQLMRGANAGRLLIPSDHRSTSGTSWGAHVLMSNDHGATWQIGAVDTHSSSSSIHPNENVAVELVDGRVYFNARDQSGSDPATRAIAYSTNGGATYAAPFVAEPSLTTPVVQNSVVRFAATDAGDAKNILIHSGPGQAASRNDLTIRVSFDEGTTWVMETLLDPGPAAYSDLVKIDSGRIGVLYEAGQSLYQEILFSSFQLSDLNPLPWNGVPGDVNQNGVLDTADVNAFVLVWKPLNSDTYRGGVDSYTHGDLNFNGINDLGDVFLLRQALLAQGASASALADLLSVPEPSTLVLAMGVCTIHFGWRGWWR